MGILPVQYVANIGVVVATDIFQSRLFDLLGNLEYVVVYFDNIMIIGNGTFEEQLQLIEVELTRWLNVGMQVNPSGPVCLLHLPVRMCGKNEKFGCTDQMQEAFAMVKTKISNEAMLAHPDFSKPFNVHTD